MKIKMLCTFTGFTVNHEGEFVMHVLNEGKTYEMLDYWAEQFFDQGLAVKILEVKNEMRQMQKGDSK